MKNKIVLFTCDRQGKLVDLQGRVKNNPEKETGILLEGVTVQISEEFEATMPDCFVSWRLVRSEVKILTPAPAGQ